MVAAKIAGVRDRPKRSPRGVVHEAGHLHLRIVPVIRQNRDATAPREGGPDKPVVRLVSESPTSAMPEDDHRTRRRGGRARFVHVQTMLRIGAV